MSRSATALGLLVVALAAPAAADDNDLVLSRLATVTRNSDGMATGAIGDGRAFRSLASELGVVLAPRLGEPADTLGFGGFALTTDIAITTISSDASFWRVLESSPAPEASGVDHGDSMLTTVGFMAKKGLWLPVPSFEMGLGAVHLLGSRIWAAQVYGKIALHEGFHDWLLPSFALRGGASRMMGQSDLDLTVGSIDVVASKDFGIGGTFALSPYLGGDLLVIVARSEVIDATPEVDATAEPMDRQANFVFLDQDSIYRTRIYGGVKFKYYVLSAGIEAAFARAGRSRDDRGAGATCGETDQPTSACDSPDDAGTQSTLTITVGADF